MQIPLGVLPKNETKYEDMIDILEEYKKYVPYKIVKLKEPLEDNITEDHSFVTTLLGGDYLSAARARGAQVIRRNSELEKHRLDGVLPVSEDWHAKVCLLEASTINLVTNNKLIHRCTGRGCIKLHRGWKEERFISFVTSSIEEMSPRK